MERRVGSAPSLGMLRPVNFVPRALHDPAGEFAIVLYDPTIDDEPTPKIQDGTLHTQTLLGLFWMGADGSCCGGGEEGGE